MHIDINEKCEKELQVCIEYCIRILRGLDHSNPVNEEKIYQQQFLIRLFRHVNTIQKLRNGFNYEGVSDHDAAALLLVMRSILESHLIFFYIFINPQSKAENEIRFMCWKREGLMSRQIINPTNHEHVLKKKKELKQIEDLFLSIRNNCKFNNLSRHHSDRRSFESSFERKGTWRPSWKKIMLLMGHSKYKTETLYSFLSGHVHSEYSNYMQQLVMLRDNLTSENINTYTEIILPTINAFIYHIGKSMDILNLFSEEELTALKNWELINAKPENDS